MKKIAAAAAVGALALTAVVSAGGSPRSPQAKPPSRMGLVYRVIAYTAVQ